MLRAVIIDDERNARIYLAGLLALDHSGVSIVSEADSVASGLAAIKAQNPDLVLLDIQMQDGTGFDLLRALGQQGWNLNKLPFHLIFTTAHDQYALDAIRFSALDYLLKPVERDELTRALGKIEKEASPVESRADYQLLIENLEALSRDKKRIALNTADKTHLVRILDILRCESEGNYTTFFLRNGDKILTSRSLKECEELLSPYGFERLHKSHLINLEALRTFEKQDGGFAVMEDQSRVPVASRKREHLQKILRSL